MPEAGTIAPVVQEPTKIPPPTQAGSQGAGALAEGEVKSGVPPWTPREFELKVDGQSRKLKFDTEDQLKAVLQKALYADQVIKNGAQATKGAEALMQKLKTPQGLREVLQDPDINMDVKKFALGVVQEMMEDEKLTPEQREFRETTKERDTLRAEKTAREEQEKQRIEQEKNQKQAQGIRTEIIDSMKKYPDIPQTQATMDAVIQNMRAAFRRFGRHLTPEQAMAVYSQQYWQSLGTIIDKMNADQILKRFGSKTLDKIQQLKLNELKNKTNPATQKFVGSESAKKKKHLTEKEFEKHFQELAGL